MAAIKWIGTATAVAQVDSLTVGVTIEIGDIFNITVTGRDGATTVITYTAAATTIADVTAGLVAAWNISTNALCTGVTATDNNPIVTLTADTAGTGFSVAVETTEAGGGASNAQTFVRTSATPNAGPSDWSTASNWSTGSVPTGAHDVYVEGATIYYGLDQSAIDVLDSLNITQSQIGVNPASGRAPNYLQTKATIVSIGAYTGPSAPTQSSPINIDTGATESTINIYSTGSNTTMPGVRIKAASAATKINVNKGTVGVANIDGETSTVGVISVSYDTNVQTDANAYIGAGVTLTTLTKTGGIAVLGCEAGTVTNTAGALETVGSGGITTALNVKGGTVTPNSTGTILLATLTGGTTDFSKSSVARTATTIKLEKGATLIYDPDVLITTNDIASDSKVTLSAS